MKKTLVAGVAALLMATSAAHARKGWSVGMWNCPDVSVDGARIELRKRAVHNYELKIIGRFQVNPLRATVKELRDGTITLNGKRCHLTNEPEDWVDK
jgi:hypothetical protein